MFFPFRNCSRVLDLSTQLLTEVFFVLFSILKACTEESVPNTQVCSKYSVKETCAREIEGQVTGHWNFLPLTMSFKVLD
jgi:hypothetical protein